MNAWKSWIATSLACVLLGSSSAAQCPLPDGLDGGMCCTDVAARLPQAQAFSHGALGICWRNCDVEALQNCTARWSRPRAYQRVVLNVPVPLLDCGLRFAKLELLDAGGARKLAGRMRLLYSRTWLETDSAGNDLQVWRFLVNGDLQTFAAAGPAPCPTPPCAAAFNGRARYTGYIDYARDCTTGTFQHAWMLTHSCDLVDHRAGFPRGGVYHPDRTYTLVGPSAGFAVGPIQPLASGGTSLEGMRRLRLPAAGSSDPVRCQPEELIDAGLEPIQELCLCTLPIAPLQYAISDLGLASSCGASLTSPGGPFLPGYVSMGIGTWTAAGSYPGLERLRWTCGGYENFDPCTGNTRDEVFFGVTTLGGYFARQVLAGGTGSTLPLAFVDQCNALRAGAAAMNTRYVSNQLIQLNF